ncbi:hypothetical protein DFH07DRAFT_780926 [Mycena maculata]|uniref:Uncharacterized protein n=1 Tax=Mycena maculata TaxID=230809 RepID=A0AAD7I0Z2_9AGAR|nr:hypothetical protein DFH07DRAFT_780926 [Mycena maculata]
MLSQKLILVIDERDRHVVAFQKVNATLKKELRKSWQKRIDEWEEDVTKPNPYELEGKGSKLHGLSVTSFLVAGLQLEEVQHRIWTELKGHMLIAANQNERVAEMRVAFFSKPSKFRKLQAVYMSAAIRELEDEEDRRNPELPPLRAEDVRLLLPSGLRTADREDRCKKGYPRWRASCRRDSVATPWWNFGAD